MRDDDCVFCTLPEWEESEQFVLNIEPLNPVTLGHRLFVPRTHVRDAAQDPATTAQVVRSAATYGAFQQVPFNVITSVGAEATQSVFHLHVHYVPRSEGDGLHLPWTGQVVETFEQDSPEDIALENRSRILGGDA